MRLVPVYLSVALSMFSSRSEWLSEEYNEVPFPTLPTQLRSELERGAEMLERQESCRGESMVTHRRDKRRVRLAYHAAKG